MTVTPDIGARIRRIRNEQKRTLQDIADVCGFTKSLLSKIETGKVTPPIATLVKIAGALQVGVATLIEADATVHAVHDPRSKVDSGVIRTKVGYGIFPFATDYHDKRMQPFLFVARRGEVAEHRLDHTGEEFIYIVAGAMRVRVGDRLFDLEAGDGLYFNAAETHGITPVSEEVRYINIFT